LDTKESVKFLLEKIFDKVKNKHHSSQVQVNCPYCAAENGESDNKFNLEVNLEKNVFKCWKCNNRGTLSKLIFKFGGKEDKTYFKGLDIEYSFNSKQRTPKPVAVGVKLPSEYVSFSEINVFNYEHLEALNYLLSRGLTLKTIIYYKLGFCLSGLYKNRIIIPSYDAFNRLNYFTARSYTGNKLPYINVETDKQQIIFNEQHINWNSTITLIEGVFEMFVVYNPIVLLGKVIGEAVYSKLIEHKPNIIIGLDPDASKEIVEQYLALKDIGLNVKFMDIKIGKDLSEINQKQGRYEVIKLYKTARELEFKEYKAYALYQ